MPRPLGLHQVSLLHVEPLQLIEIAGACGCDEVSLFTHLPEPTLPGQKDRLMFPTVTGAMKQAVVRSLAANGLTVGAVEFFPITEDADLAGYGPALALGRELGATRAVTHIHDRDGARAAEKLGALCDLAAREGLTVAIEFSTMTWGCQTVESAAWFVDQIRRSNLGIGVDFLHLVRSGGTAEAIAGIDAGHFCYAQICDGQGLHVSSDYMREAGNRELPGDGDFPLKDILRALPAATALEVEVPSHRRRKAGVPALDHVRDAVDRTRALIEAVTPAR